jgi:spermidine synthase
LGLILAYQINSKIELPNIKQIIKWHVNFGISMSIIGLIHFLWHWNYYKNIFSKEQNNKLGNKKDNSSTSFGNEIDSKTVILSSIVTGFNAIIFQVVFLREIINIFSGNELITGLVLATWMGLTGIGALMKGKQAYNGYNLVKITKLLILLAILPVIIYVLLYITKWFFFPPGVLIGAHLMFPIIILVLTPYCILSGYVFSYLAALYKMEKQSYRTDKLYIFETIGSIAGGICISFVFIQWISAFHTLVILLIIQLGIVYYLYRYKTYKSKVFYVIAILTAFIILTLPIDIRIKSILFPNQEIVKNIESPYGNVLLTKQDNQYNLYTSHNLLFSSHNVIENEEDVHYAMLQHQKPSSILIISDGNTQIIPEILKYRTVTHIDFLLENKWLFKLIPGTDSIISNKKVHIKHINIRRFLKESKHIYDVILISTYNPVTLQANRFFTYEFFIVLKAHTNHNSVISLQLASTNNYPSAENIALHSLTFQTLRAVFKNCIIVPGEKDYFLASQIPLSLEISKLSQERNPNNQYVNPYYIDDFTLQQRSRQLLLQLKPSNFVNEDFKPMAVFLNNNLYLGIFSVGRYLLFVPVILLLLPLIKIKKYDFAMYVAGFSISSFQILMLMVFQVVFGSVYAASGIIFSICMTGLALGAYWGSIQNKKVIKNKIIINQGWIGVVILLLTIGVSYYNFISGKTLIYITFFISIIVPSILTGMQFSFIVQYNKTTSNTISGKIYAIDLFGSALGAYLTSVLLLPLVGFLNMSIVILILNIVVIIVLFMGNKR